MGFIYQFRTWHQQNYRMEENIDTHKIEPKNTNKPLTINYCKLLQEHTVL